MDLLLTMRFDPLEGVVELERHLARLKNSARALELPIDRHAVRNELHAATFRLTEPSALRLRISPAGATAIAASPLLPPPAAPVTVSLAPLPLAPDERAAQHVTAARANALEAARAAAGTWETLFLDAGEELLGGSFADLFVPAGDRLRTPVAAPGLVPGILREMLLEEGAAIEAPLRPADLAGGFLLGDALHGLIPALLA